MSINKAEPVVSEQIVATPTSSANIPKLRGPGLYSVQMGLPSGETVCYLIMASRNGGVRNVLNLAASSSLKPLTQTANDELTITSDGISLKIGQASAVFSLTSNPTRTINLVMKKIF